MTLSKAVKRPHSIRIFGRTYEVLYTKVKDLDGSYGLCDKINQLLHIATDVGDEELKDTVIHEALHVAHRAVLTTTSSGDKQKFLAKFTLHRRGAR